jgi:multidrug efflux system membrane fusion protein
MKYFSMAALILLISACSAKEEPQESVTRAVHITTVKLSNHGEQHEFSGEIVSRYESTLAFQVSGKMSQRYVDKGDIIKKGQLLAKIDSKDYDLRVQQARANLSVAKANDQQSHSEIQRYTKLLADRLISQSQFDQKFNQNAVTAAQLSSAKTALRIAENQQQYTYLKATENGVVTDIYAEKGQILQAGQKVISVANPKHKEIAIELPENDIYIIRNTANASITLWALPGISVNGVIREISPSADSKTRTYATRISLLTNDPKIQLGMTASVSITENSGASFIDLPLSALLKEEENLFVWVISPADSTLIKTPVELGELTKNKVIIKSGLEDNQQVVIAGIHMLHEGQKVRTYQPQNTL